MGRGEGSDDLVAGSVPPRVSGAARAGDAPDRRVVGAERVFDGLRRLRAVGMVGREREFDLWLVALRAGAMTPAEAAEKLAVDPARMRNRIHRWHRNSAVWGRNLFAVDDAGGYVLTAPGARHADAVVVSLRRAFAGLATL